MIETTKAVTIPTNKTPISEIPKLFPFNKNLTIFNPLAPNITGIPKKKENSVATKRELPIMIAPKIVAPEREVPGIKDSS